MNNPYNQILGRRQALKSAACGFGHLAFAGMLGKQAMAAGTGAAPGAMNPLAVKQGDLPAKAKRVIFIFMQGGPSHVDSFDYKPRLEKDNGKMRIFDDARTKAKTGKVIEHRIMKSLWDYKRYGQCGLPVSDLFPHIAKHADDLCVLKGMHTEGVAHGPATLFLHTGTMNMIRPSMGSWTTYGLGSENENLPGFVTINPSMGNGGPRNYSNGFLPAVYQGTAVGRAGIPAKEARIRNIKHPSLPAEEQRKQFELLRAMNQAQVKRKPQEYELDALINSYELAWRMQNHAPNTLDLSGESKSTLKMYGIDEKETDNFGRQCLMGRRLAEAGVRYIQINYTDNTNNPAWDQHSNMPKHKEHAFASDKPVAGLLQDLKQRGLLEDTLVWWGGEFGRTPYSQSNGTGRDHNSDGFTVWLAGGGVKAGFSYGETDEFGHRAVDGKIHMHDLHATILHQLGLDHERLTYPFDGRDYRLTDVAGRVVDEIIA
ncbi:MAG: DUF1501 domain-containing protein [Verrucomicrobiota bacterium]